MIHQRARVMIALAFAFAISSLACVSPPVAEETVITVSPIAPVEREVEPKTNSVSAQIKSLVEMGTPPSLIQALELIRDRGLGPTEFGRSMTAAVVALMRMLYPEIRAELPIADPPPTHPYTKILREVERDVYTPASSTSVDYLEFILSFLALLDETGTKRLESAMPDLERAAVLNDKSPLEPYFRGLFAERQGRPEAALQAYDIARLRSADCYPAAIAAARVRTASGRATEAIPLLQELLTKYPDNESIKKVLAKAYYAARDWPRAGPALADILSRYPNDLDSLLMRAHTLVEQGSLPQAQPLLERVAKIEKDNRLCLFLLARVQAEVYRDTKKALGYLDDCLKVDPDDPEVLNYATKLLLESKSLADVEKGRVYLQRLLAVSEPALTIIDLALKDAIARSAWTEALPLVARLLAERRSAADLFNAATVYTGLGDIEDALKFSAELYGGANPTVEIVGLYVNSLIAAGRGADAERVIAERLPAITDPIQRSRLFYIRSRLTQNDDNILSYLRSAVFEDASNVDALIAMMEYHRTHGKPDFADQNYRRAVEIAPDNPILRGYKEKYGISDE